MFAIILKTEKQKEAARRRWANRVVSGAHTEKDLQAMLDKLPVKHNPNLRQEATTYTGDRVETGNAYKELDPKWQKEILTHEAAHFHGLDDWYLKNHQDWDLAAKTKHGHLNGQTTPGEIMAEGYARAWHDPEFLKAQAPELVKHIKEGAKAVGLPVPNI